MLWNLVEAIKKEHLTFNVFEGPPWPRYWWISLSLERKGWNQKAASYTKTPVLEYLFNSEYYEIFQSTYFEEHLQTAASEDIFIKIIHKEN